MASQAKCSSKPTDTTLWLGLPESVLLFMGTIYCYTMDLYISDLFLRQRELIGF